MMSKFVCNVAKFKRGQLYGMDIHIQRKTTNHSNNDIDVSRSKLNYELVENFNDEHYYNAVNERIKNGYMGDKILRKDATFACGVLISSDQEFFKNLSPEDEKKFFEIAYKYLCDKYGTENIISAKIHKDETTPHMHVMVVPLTKDGRLSAKELFNRRALTELHNDIPKLLKNNGFNIERGEHGTKQKRMETDEYKRIVANSKIDVSINENDVKPRILKNGLLKNEYETNQQIADRLNEKYINPLTEKIENLSVENAIIKHKNIKKNIAEQYEDFNKNAILDIYENIKKYGKTHTQNVIFELHKLAIKLNERKRFDDIEKERLKNAEIEKRAKQNADKKLLSQFKNNDNLYKIADFGNAKYKFKNDGEQSFYISLENIKSGSIITEWGNHLKSVVDTLKITINTVVRYENGKFELPERINQSITPLKRNGGMSI